MVEIPPITAGIKNCKKPPFCIISLFLVDKDFDFCLETSLRKTFLYFLILQMNVYLIQYFQKASLMIIHK